MDYHLVWSTVIFLPISLVTLFPASAQDKTKKAPVPSEAAQAVASKLIKEVYGDEYANADSLVAKQVLGKKLLERAKETQDELASKYILLRISRDVAAQGLDGPTAFQAIDAMSESFQVDGIEMKTVVLIKGASAAKTKNQHLRMTQPALKLVDLALAGENYAAAQKLCGFAITEANKAGDAELAGKVFDLSTEVEEFAKLFDNAKIAAPKLKANPVDSEANLNMGKYLCFVKGDWGKGVLMLALGNDVALKTLAQKETLEEPTSSVQQANAADKWWELAEKSGGATKNFVQRRATYWYRKALPGLSGLTKDKVEKRLGQVPTLSEEPVGGESTVPKEPQLSPAIVQPPPEPSNEATRKGTPGYAIIWRGEAGKFLECRAVAAGNRVEIELRARGFQDALQARTVFDSATPQVVSQVQNNNKQLNLISQNQQEGKMGDAFVRKIQLLGGR